MADLDAVMRRLRSDDEDALRDLMFTWRHLLDSLAHQILGDRSAADDVVQEAFVLIWRKREQYDPARPAWPWIARIIRNLCHQRWRRRYRTATAHLSDPAVNYASYLRPPQPTPLALSERAELLAIARLRISLLPPLLREVVQLSLFEEKTNAEIAALLGLAIGTVKSRKHRGLRRLREVTDDNDSRREQS